MKIYDYIQTIETKEDFLHFLKMFRESFAEGRSPTSQWGTAEVWENDTMDRYLDALEAYSGSIRIKDEPSWRQFAEMLYVASVHE